MTADGLSQSGRHGEELLEFSFRRVFDEMTASEKSVVQVLSLFQSPVPTEALLIGSGQSHDRVLDAVNDLVGDSVIQRFFDADRNDYTYGLLPVARAFVYGAVSQQPDLESRIDLVWKNGSRRPRTSRTREKGLWFAKFGKGRGRRIQPCWILRCQLSTEVISQPRSSCISRHYKRNPRSWRAARLYAELQRHALGNMKAALELYAQAGGACPDAAVIGVLSIANGECFCETRGCQKLQI